MVGNLHDAFVLGRRARVLSWHLAEMIPRDAKVLDIGSGDGLIDKLILEQRPDVSIQGVDVLLRPKAHIPTILFDGEVIPYSERSFDVVVFIDVLHHTVDPTVMLKEAKRVTRRCIIIKDHNLAGFVAGPILRFMDWIGNARHGVALTYNYLPERHWNEMFSRLGLRVEERRTRLGLYPPVARWIFERSLHFLVRLNIDTQHRETA
jgi:SAM-dependent methyltransferase